MAAKQTLPRLQVGGEKKPPKTREVELPELGASVLIRKPTTGQFIEIQKVAETLSEVEQAMALAAMCLVEPNLSAEELREAIDDWPVSDWLTLQQACVEFAGVSQEALREAQRGFRGPDD